MNTTRPRIAPSVRAATTRAAITAFLDEQHEPVTVTQVMAGAGVGLTSANRWLPELAICVNAEEAAVRVAGRQPPRLWVGR